MKTVTLATLALLATAAAAQAATWSPFVIRDPAGDATPVTPVGTSDGSAYTVLIDQGGEKAGYGTSFFDGQKLSNVKSVDYGRVDTGTSSPYLNIWVTNGTQYAVVAPVVGMNNTGNYTGGEDVRGQDLQTLGFNIYEFSGNASTPGNFDWLVPGSKRVLSALLKADNTPVTLADIGNLTVDDPNPAIAQGGGGAPKNGTGFNIIFGDTGSNFVSAIPYSITNAVVPEPTTLAAIAGGAVLLLGRRRRRQA